MEGDNVRWTNEIVEYLRGQFAAKKKRSQIIVGISENFGISVSQSQLHNAINRSCQAELKQFAEQELETIKKNSTKARELIAQGMTAPEAARVLGVDVGRIYAWVPTGRADYSKTTWIGKGFEDYLSGQMPSDIEPDPTVDHGKLIVDLGAEDCRWPIGKDADGQFRFCGCLHHRPRKERPYCETHAALDRRAEILIHPNSLAAFHRQGSKTANAGRGPFQIDPKTFEEYVPEAA